MHLPYTLKRPVYALRERRVTRDWQDATDLRDLGRKTAAWLTGDLPIHPGWDGGGPSPETIPLAARLAAYNRVGLITLESQPGQREHIGQDGAIWAQRAALQAIADKPTARRVASAAELAGMLTILRPAGSIDVQEAVTVTHRDGLTVTVFGPGSPESLHGMFYPCTRPSLRRELNTAWQVVVIDPQWGREDTLWRVVSRALDLVPQPAIDA